MEKLMVKWSKLMTKWSNADIQTQLQVMKDDRNYAMKTGDSRWEKILDEEIRKLEQKLKVKPICLDLYSGLGGFSQAMIDRGWTVIRVDNDSKFKPDICADVRDLTADCFPKNVDLIVASPPCECFSVATISIRWKNYLPDRRTLDAIGLIFFTKFLIERIKPRFWVLENPRGMLRKVLGMPAITTYWGAWGMPYLKPTDLWGKLPPMKFPPKPKIYEAAPRGSKTGVQGVQGTTKGTGCGKGGKDLRPRAPELRALIPYAFSIALAEAVEKTRLDYFMEKS